MGFEDKRLLLDRWSEEHEEKQHMEEEGEYKAVAGIFFEFRNNGSEKLFSFAHHISSYFISFFKDTWHFDWKLLAQT